MKRAEQLMKLQDSRKETIRRYRHREITHIEAIRFSAGIDRYARSIAISRSVIFSLSRNTASTSAVSSTSIAPRPSRNQSSLIPYVVQMLLISLSLTALRPVSIIVKVLDNILLA